MHTVITQDFYIQRAEITSDVENGFDIYFLEERMRIHMFCSFLHQSSTVKILEYFTLTHISQPVALLRKPETKKMERKEKQKRRCKV